MNFGGGFYRTLGANAIQINPLTEGCNQMQPKNTETIGNYDD